MWITAALAAVQIISGIVASTKKAADARKAASSITRPSVASTQAVSRARIQANSTTTPGASLDLETGRQAAADTIGAAKQTASDSSKVSAATTRAQVLQNRNNNRITSKVDDNRNIAENRLQGALSQLSNEQRRGKIAADQIYAETNIAKANILGAGINNVMSISKDKEMMKFYEGLYGSGGAVPAGG